MTTVTHSEDVDVLIVGAGLSGIGAAHYLRRHHPGKSLAIVEARDHLGGTWDLFRYPGIRSDSDLYTFAFEFKPWRSADSIADGRQILSYLKEAAAEEQVEPLIRYRHRVISASWSTTAARWTVRVQAPDAGAPGELAIRELTARWLFCATGYYRYDEGYRPRFDGEDDFGGQLIHPQHWPDGLDYAGRRVVVIGSGATAVTLVPALAVGPGAAEHVTMLQRTPSYIMPLPRADGLSKAARRVLSEQRAFRLIRRRNIAVGQWTWRLVRRYPATARKLIRRVNTRLLPAGYDVARHFNPPYNPGDQRLCAARDGDFFAAIRSGKASVVTGTVTSLDADGIKLASGEHLSADIIVTATGLNLLLFGGMTLDVDGQPVTFADTTAYRGMMLSGVPNLAYAIGYTNASWTLKVGLLCEYFCRLLAHMDEGGYDIARAEPDPAMARKPLLDFGAGYVQRSLQDLPRQGADWPWVTSTSYYGDRKLLREGAITDKFLHLSPAGPPPAPAGSGAGTAATGPAESERA